MNLTQDDLDAWRVNPVTEYLTEIIRKKEDFVKDSILSDTWYSGEVDQNRMIHCKAVGLVLEALIEATADDFMAMEAQLDAK